MAGVKCVSTGRGIMHSFSFLKYCLSCSQGHWGAGIYSCCLRVKAVLRPVTCHQFNRRATQRDKHSSFVGMFFTVGGRFEYLQRSHSDTESINSTHRPQARELNSQHSCCVPQYLPLPSFCFTCTKS